MNRIRMGVMGCADIAWRAMIPAMIECEGIRLIAIASRTEEKVRKFAHRFKLDAVVGYDTLLEREDIDAVYIPLPTGLHEEWVIETLKAGKHILIEKSFAARYKSALRMVDLAREKGLLIMENFLFPHHSQYAWIKEFVLQGELGEIRLLRSTFGFPHLSKDNFRYSRDLGGGALLDAGAYVVKASQLFLGRDLETIGATLKYDDEFDVDVFGSAMLINLEQQIAQVSFGFGCYYQCTLELLGSEGKLVTERTFTSPPGFRPTVRVEYQDRKQKFMLPADNQYANMCRFFSDTVRNGDEFQSQWESLLNQARILDEIQRRCADGFDD